MKKLFVFLILLLSPLILFASDYNVVMAYNSDDPYSVCAAAVVYNKFTPQVIVDCAVSDSAAQRVIIEALEDSSWHKIYLLVDTNIVAWAANDFNGALWDEGVLDLLFTPTPLNGYNADAAPVYVIATVSTTRAETTWERSEIYAGITEPLIVLYLSEAIFVEEKADATGGTDTTLLVTNPDPVWVTGEWDGDYVYVTLGPGLGEARVIDTVEASNAADVDTIKTTTAFSTAITNGSDFTVITQERYSVEGFYDVYAYYGILAEINDIESSLDEWKKLLDDNNKLNNIPLGSGRSSRQDLSYLNTILGKGEDVFDYLIVIQ